MPRKETKRITQRVERRIRKILKSVKLLAVEYYDLTKKPLGVTGEIAEYEAARILGLKLAPARTAGYDAVRGKACIQIKGRACDVNASGQRMGRIKEGCDKVMLVLLDKTTLNAYEIWEVPFASVRRYFNKHPTQAHRGLPVGCFKRMAKKPIFPLPKSLPKPLPSRPKSRRMHPLNPR